MKSRRKPLIRPGSHVEGWLILLSYPFVALFATGICALLAGVVKAW
jgi:hypothetical protein